MSAHTAAGAPLARPVDTLNIAAIQDALRADGLDGWLLYDFRGLNPIATDITAVQRQGGHLATVEVSKVRRAINIDLLEDAPPQPGDWVLIHVGFAMSRISADEAAEQLRLLAMLGEDAQAMQELDGYRFDDTGRAPSKKETPS